MWIQTDIDLVSLLQDTSPVAKAVLAILQIFSVWSWGIILSKVLLLRKVRRESEIFWKIFRKGQNLSEISTACETLRFTPLVAVLNSGAEILQPRAPRGGGGMAVKTAVSVRTPQRVMQRTAAPELTGNETRRARSATTGSLSPV